MEYPEPWHSRPEEDWPRLQEAMKRLNRLRLRRGLAIKYQDSPPIRAVRLDVEPLSQTKKP